VRRIGPRHAAVWVRIGGRWRKGRIIEWICELGTEGWHFSVANNCCGQLGLVPMIVDDARLLPTLLP